VCKNERIGQPSSQGYLPRTLVGDDSQFAIASDIDFLFSTAGCYLRFKEIIHREICFLCEHRCVELGVQARFFIGFLPSSGDISKAERRISRYRGIRCDGNAMVGIAGYQFLPAF
jgi:hypothetical protein